MSVTVSYPDAGGTSFIHGTSGSDLVGILASRPNEMTVITNSGVRHYAFSNLQRLRVQLYGGNDSFMVTGNHRLHVDLDAGDGNDSVIGGAGNDTLRGGNGNDLLSPGIGRNQIFGNVGFDRVDYSSASQGVYVSLNDGTDDGPIFDNEGRDNVRSDVEGIIGSNFHDYLSGSSAANTIDGRSGNDIIYGLAGNDTITGGDGNDSIWGQGGADRIIVNDDGLGWNSLDSVYVDFNDVVSSSAVDKIYR